MYMGSILDGTLKVFLTLNKMTLIIACICKDGIVVGADSQMTMGSAAGPIRKKTLDKIIPLSKGILVGGAGSVSVIQKIKKKINEIPNEVKDTGKIDDIKNIICNQIIHPIRKEMLNKFKDLYGERGEENAPSADLILAGYSNNNPVIHLISKDGLEEEEDNYCAIGIGDAFAQISLKDYDTRSLNVEIVKVLVYRAIFDAIETGAYGMGEPINIWAIKLNNEEAESKKLNESELKGIKDTVEAIREINKEHLLDKINQSDEEKKKF